MPPTTVLNMQFFPTPPVGHTIVWYPQAQVDISRGIAGIVTKAMERGRLGLTLWPATGTPRPIRMCHHVIDPIHKRRTEMTIRYGGWDFIRGNGPDRYLPQCKDLKDYLQMELPSTNNREEDALMERILAMYSQGYRSVDIARDVDRTVGEVNKFITDILHPPKKQQRSTSKVTA